MRKGNIVPQQNKLSALGERIDTARQRRGLTLYQVAKNANMDYAQLYRTMRSTANPKRETLLRICRALGSPLQEVIEIFNVTDNRAPTQDELEEESVAA